jgi:hypothetical protein
MNFIDTLSQMLIAHKKISFFAIASCSLYFNAYSVQSKETLLKEEPDYD